MHKEKRLAVGKEFHRTGDDGPTPTFLLLCLLRLFVAITEKTGGCATNGPPERWPQKGTKGAKTFSFCAFCASSRLLNSVVQLAARSATAGFRLNHSPGESRSLLLRFSADSKSAGDPRVWSGAPRAQEGR